VNSKFWQTPNSWPRDAPEYVFLARAFDKIGRAVFPDDWVDATAYEVIYNLPSLPSTSQSATTPQRRYAHRLLESRHPSFGRPRLSKLRVGSSTITSVPPFSEKEWRTAYDITCALHQKSERAKQQYLEVQHIIAAECEDSKLVVATRSNTDGKMNQCSPTIWNTEPENWSQRFDKCQLDPVNPMTARDDTKGLEWIFVTEISLDNLLQRLSARRPSIQVQQTIASETQCLTWLTQEMRKNEDPPKAKNAYREEAKKQFGTGHRAFDRAWAKAITATNRTNWSNSGRKRKSAQ
jgi:hypothetical protein